MTTVWVFCGEGGNLPSGVFSSEEAARAWIQRCKLTGILTEYPVDISAYDWAIEHGVFKPNQPWQDSPKFIGRFTSASLHHLHFHDGDDGSAD